MTQQVQKEHSELLLKISHLQKRLKEMKETLIPSSFGPSDDDQKQMESNFIRAQFSIAHTIDAIFWINEHGRFEFVNRSACNSLGYTRDELLQMSVSDIDPDLTAEAWPDHWNQLSEKRTLVFQSRHRAKSGKVFHVEVAANFVKFDNKEYNCAFVRDISERKRAELALYLSEQRFRAIADYTYDWELWISPGGRVLWTNPAVERISGYNVDECMAMYDYPMSIICPDDRPAVKAAFDKGLQGKSGHGIEVRLTQKDGPVLWVSISWQPIYDKKGVSQGIRASIRDIHERKQVQQERENLLKTLAARNEELESIVYVSSHDLRTPLVNIQGFSGELFFNGKEIRRLLDEIDLPEQTKHRLDEILNTEVPQSLDFINSSAKKIASILNGLTRLSYIARATLTTIPINANEVLADVVASMKPKIDKKDTAVIVEDLPTCVADQNQFHQIFENLIDNALNNLDPQRHGIIRITGIQEEASTTYCVEDNGIGIAERYYEAIFKPFLKIRRQNQTPGEGLGLTIVKRIAAGNNGKVWIEPNKENGTIFKISLPANKQKPEA